MTRHYYQMIVAGTPVFICPSKEADLDDLDLYAQIEKANVDNMTFGDYTLTGFYDFGPNLKQYDYYVGGDGNIWNWPNATTNLKATRAIITHNLGAEGARLTIASNDEETTTPIVAVYDTETKKMTLFEDGNVYNLNGQVVRKNATSLEGLAKGIYIVNGKKVSVK
jgi:hypothetical protein